LSLQEVTHYLMAGGECLCLQVVEGGLLLQEAGVGSGNVDVIEVGHALRSVLVVDTADHDLKAAYGKPPSAIVQRVTS
jgi:hypothetical protein